MPRKVLSDKELMRLAESGKTPTQLAIHCGVHKATMWNHFRRLGIPTISWSEEETSILGRNGYLNLEQIQYRLKLYGYERSLPAIEQKRKRARCGVRPENSLRGIADGMGVHIQTVNKWIKDGRLKTKRVPDQRVAGFRHFIKEKSIRDFILKNVDQIDLGKVDKWWFIDILADSGQGVGSYVGYGDA